MIVLYLCSPMIHYLRLLRVVRPFLHSCPHLVDDGFGATPFHQGVPCACSEIVEREPVTLAVRAF